MEAVKVGRSDDTDDKTRAVLQAATTVFLSHGFSAATTDMIQAKAGVSKATVYARYPNKEALFLAVIEHQCHLFDEKLQALAPAAEGISDTLKSLGKAYLDVVLSPEALALFRVVVAEAPRFPQIGRTFYQSGPKVIHDHVQRILEAAAEAGELDLRCIGVSAATALFLGMLRHEAQLEYLTHPHAQPSEVQRDVWVHQSVVTLLRAYASRG